VPGWSAQDDGEREEDRPMPTYEYACRKCGEHLEVVQAFSDDALTTCPNCGGALRKVFGRVGISFKGDGFYKTDSRKTSSASSRSDPAEKTEKSDGGTKVGATNGSGGDSKPSKPAESTSDTKPSKPTTPAASA
jgi:putative FmdB family regulatory protein